MPLVLDGMQKKDLRHALLDAFPTWNALRQMASDQLNVNLAAVTAQSGNLEDNAYELIAWAAARGIVADLLLGGRNQNPTHPGLQDLAARLSLSASAKVPASALQKVVSANVTFLDVARWRAEMTRAEWRVCRVDCGNEGVGTGFLVGKDLVLTNHHVVADLLDAPAEAPAWRCRFDHKLSETGDVISMGRVVRLAPEWQVDAAPPSEVDELPDPKPRDPGKDELDFALLRLAEPVGAQPVGKGAGAEEARGWVRLSPEEVAFGNVRVLAILQHPRELPMKLALGTEERPQLAGGGRRLRYHVPTEPGSSGSPVFDGDWRLVALHHSGDPREAAPDYNEAIPASLIAARPKVAAAIA